jgi:hypothetical protein
MFKLLFLLCFYSGGKSKMLKLLGFSVVSPGEGGQDSVKDRSLDLASRKPVFLNVNPHVGSDGVSQIKIAR